MAEAFRSFLTAGLAAVQRDAPACARAVAAALGPAVIELAVDGERVAVRSDGGRVVAGAAIELARSGRPRVGVVTTGRALLALIGGKDELYPAIVANRVRVQAAPRDAERLFDALRWFIEGCARSRAAPALLAEYQRSIETVTETVIEPVWDRRPA
jgi:hypothetical protein